jgi:sugar phosphate isomerase/epimerase
MPPTIGLQLYTLRDDLERGSRAAVLERVAGLGVQSVEPFGFLRGDLGPAEQLAEARALRAEAEAAGLAISSTHTSIPEDADRLFEDLAEAGIPVAVAPVPEAVAGFTRDAFGDPDALARLAERLSALADVAERHGARVAYHNHWFEWAPLPDGRLGYDVLWELVDPRVIAEVDLYWAQAAGQVPADVVATLGPRVELVHVKDGPGTMERPPQQVAPGDGDIALADALAAGRAITTGVIEADAVAGGGDPYEYVARGVAWLRRTT